MIALEYLQQRKEDLISNLECCDGEEYEYIMKELPKINKVILELQALQDINCDKCKWFYDESQECMSFCARGFEDKFEPKDKNE